MGLTIAICNWYRLNRRVMGLEDDLGVLKVFHNGMRRFLTGDVVTQAIAQKAGIPALAREMQRIFKPRDDTDKS